MFDKYEQSYDSNKKMIYKCGTFKHFNQLLLFLIMLSSDAGVLMVFNSCLLVP